MYFKINKKVLIENINIALRAISVNSPLPVLHNIKLSAKNDCLELTASDNNISIKSTIINNEDSNLQIINEGDILLDGKYIADMVRKIDSEVVEVEILDGCLTNIRGMAVSFELNGISATNYPLIDFTKPEESFDINAEELKNIINSTCFATSDKETRPVLTGLNLNCDDVVLTCVATDSFRLAQKKVRLNEPHKFNITIPASSLNDISKIITNNESTINVSLSDKKALFVIDNVLVQTRLIDGLYPETSKLIPSDFAYELNIDARDILNALDRASFIKNEGIYLVRMEMSENEIVVTSKSSAVESEERIVPTSYTGEPLTISFKGNYVYDAIRALNAFKVKIQFGGSLKAFVLRGAEDEDLLQLVVPIKTYN